MALGAGESLFLETSPLESAGLGERGLGGAETVKLVMSTTGSAA